MSESPSRIILAIVGVCLLLTLLVIFRSGSKDEDKEVAAPRPGSVTSNKPARPNQFARRDNDGGFSSGGEDHPRGSSLPSSGMEAPRPGSLNTSEGKAPPSGPEAKNLEVASGTGRKLAAEPVPAGPADSGVLPIGAPASLPSAEALAAIPGAPPDASLAVPFNGNGESLGAMVPIVDEHVDYNLDEGAYFPPEARFAYGDAGNVKNNAGTIAFWIKPNWDGTDPRNASLVQYHTEDWSNRLQIFKNGIYLRYLFTDNTGNETNLSVDMQRDGWVAGDWHHIAITWGDSLITMYTDGVQRANGTYLGDLEVPTGTALWVGSDAPGGNPGADATLQDFVVEDRAMDSSEIGQMYAQGRGSGK